MMSDYVFYNYKQSFFLIVKGRIINDDSIHIKKNVISDVQLRNLRDRGDVVSPLMFP